MMLIGICGHARHGKDTAADVLVDELGFRKMSLADPMKDACRVIFPTWTNAHLYGELKDAVDPVYGISPRHALQSLGTEWGQYKLSEYDSFKDVTRRCLWVNAILARATGDVVIADVRFPHEADAIRARGGVIIMVRRTGYPVDLTHESESAMEQIRPDYVIRNGDDLETYQRDVCELMESIL
jgi:hypothetical protein